MKRILLGLAVVAAFSASAATDPASTPWRAGSPDGRTLAVHNLTFDRDVYHVTLDGTLHLLAPVAGTTVGAVFTGHGSYELTPASNNERQSLAINAIDPALKTLQDTFDAMTIFDAGLLKELMKTAPATGAPDA